MKTVNVIIPAISMEDKWFRDVPTHVLSFLETQGIQLPFANTNLCFECLSRHRFTLNKDHDLVGVNFGIIENPQQQRLYDALMMALEGPELKRKVLLLVG